MFYEKKMDLLQELEERILKIPFSSHVWKRALFRNELPKLFPAVYVLCKDMRPVKPSRKRRCSIKCSQFMTVRSGICFKMSRYTMIKVFMKIWLRKDFYENGTAAAPPWSSCHIQRLSLSSPCPMPGRRGWDLPYKPYHKAVSGCRPAFWQQQFCHRALIENSYQCFLAKRQQGIFWKDSLLPFFCSAMCRRVYQHPCAVS